MIKSFADRRTRQLFEGQHVAAYDAFADQARRRLDALVEAATLRELQALKGSRKGQYSVRINAQWRVCFRWEPAGDGGSKDPLDAPGNAIGVEIVDYR
jgi:toxin HigB-1